MICNFSQKINSFEEKSLPNLCLDVALIRYRFIREVIYKPSIGGSNPSVEVPGV